MKALCFKKEQIRKAVFDVKPEILYSVENEIRNTSKVVVILCLKQKKLLQVFIHKLGVKKKGNCST